MKIMKEFWKLILVWCVVGALSATAEVTTSPNMSLPVPIVGVTPGPDYANDINQCLAQIDSHDHSPGNGVQITNSGISSSAGIAYSKLNLAGSILNSDLAGGITAAKLSSGAATVGQVATADGAGNVAYVTPAVPSNGSALVLNASLSASVATNALTIALKTQAGVDPTTLSPVQIGFRSSTAATGTYNFRSITTALSLTIPSGTTIGTANATQAYVYVYALDNAGTVELSATLFRFDEGSTQNTTAVSGGSSSTTLYSLAARTGVPIRLIGRLSVTETTAGTWATAPSEISNIPFAQFPAPTISTVTSSSHTGGFSANASGTYTTPAGVKYLHVRLVAGGGGGGGSGTASWGTVSAGGNTTFGTSLLTANGGGAGVVGSGSVCTGGTATVAAPAIQLAAIQGAAGGGNSNITNTTTQLSGSSGGVSPFAGAGAAGQYVSPGGAAQANTGSGGGGAGCTNVSGSYSGGGGCAGGYIDALIYSPASTYSYSVGAKGSGGTAGTSGFAGGDGSGGIIIVEEFYQ